MKCFSLYFRKHSSSQKAFQLEAVCINEVLTILSFRLVSCNIRKVKLNPPLNVSYKYTNTNINVNPFVSCGYETQICIMLTKRSANEPTSINNRVLASDRL